MSELIKPPFLSRISPVFIALTAGVACKLYDDIQDNPFLSFENPYLNEALKAVHYILLSVISIVYPWFYVLLSSLHASQYGEAIYSYLTKAEWISNSYENPYEFAGLFTYILVFGVLLFPRYMFPMKKADYGLLAFTLFASFMENVSSNSKSQEVSMKKIMIRTILSLITVGVIVGLPLSTDSKLFAYYVLGYLLLSIMVQVYSLTRPKQEHDDSQGNQDELVSQPALSSSSPSQQEKEENRPVSQTETAPIPHRD